MAKKKSKKVVQMLSPENYIRQRSRGLPIHKCWITKDWREIGKTSIIISRKHTNGNISFCFYLVDLFCMGVKDTFFEFNTDERDLIERITENNGYNQFEEISYELAHNIIYSAIEFAEEYGFQPHKDFTRTTEFFLEEDDDRIKLINIECGENGKPVYFADGDDKSTVTRILKQLEKTAGKGNYNFISDDSDFEDEYEAFDDEFDEEFDKEQYQYFLNKLPNDIKDKIENVSLEEIVELCISLYQLDDEKSVRNANDLANCILSLSKWNAYEDEYLYFQMDDYLDEIELIKNIPDKYFEEAHNQISLFGTATSVKEKIENLVNDIEPELEEIENLLDKNPNIPILHYLKITNNSIDPDQSIRACNKAIKLFPDITLFEILKFGRKLRGKSKISNIHDLHEKFLGKNTKILEIEAVELILCFLSIILVNNMLSLIPFVERSIIHSSLSSHSKNKINATFYVTKMALIFNLNAHIEKNNSIE